jgi:hypothetical protein
VAGFVDSTVKDIDARMAELRGELARLEAARSALLGSTRASARDGSSDGRTRRGGRVARRGATRRPGRSRGRRGGNTRANEALQLVRSRPGISIPQIAESMGIEPNYLYRVMPRLVNDGQVRREGQGWHPA